MEILCFDIPVYFMLISKSTIHRQMQLVYALGVFSVRPDAVHCSSKTWHGNSPNMAASKNGPLKQGWLLLAPFGVSIPFQSGGVKPIDRLTFWFFWDGWPNNQVWVRWCITVSFERCILMRGFWYYCQKFPLIFTSAWFNLHVLLVCVSCLWMDPPYVITKSRMFVAQFRSFVVVIWRFPEIGVPLNHPF